MSAAVRRDLIIPDSRSAVRALFLVEALEELVYDPPSPVVNVPALLIVIARCIRMSRQESLHELVEALRKFALRLAGFLGRVAFLFVGQGRVRSLGRLGLDCGGWLSFEMQLVYPLSFRHEAVLEQGELGDVFENLREGPKVSVIESKQRGTKVAPT